MSYGFSHVDTGGMLFRGEDGKDRMCGGLYVSCSAAHSGFVIPIRASSTEMVEYV